VTPNRFFLYRWYSACMGLIEAHMCEYAGRINIRSLCKETKIFRHGHCEQ